MEYAFISNIIEANLLRAKYLLSHYQQFVAVAPSSLDISISRSVLEILSYHFQHRDMFTQEDQELIEHSGPFLVPAIDSILEEIQNYPYEIVKILYPVLYHCYFSPDGKATDYTQLKDRLNEENLFLEEEALRLWLDRGEKTFAALLFPNPLLNAISAWS